jgi:hypothetical protein
MGLTQPPADVLLIVAAFSRYEPALDWTQATLTSHWGPLLFASPRFQFTETDYYASTMGPELLKQFFAFSTLIPPDRLPDLKLQTNSLEAAYARMGGHSEPRPLNLDPGYLTPAKLVLASTKDHAHRLYVGQGIYAEITLRYHRGAWQPWQWTYPDYRRADFHQFFCRCRDWLLAGRHPTEDHAP